MAPKMSLHGRSKKSYYITIPNQCLASENFTSLSTKACKLFLDMAAQCKGYNNGDLCMTWSIMKKRGWKSQDTLARAKKELLDKGWLILTRQGGRNRCSLFAFSFIKIGDFGSKLDIEPTSIPPNDWQKWNPDS